jgi:hypothetical protein
VDHQQSSAHHRVAQQPDSQEEQGGRGMGVARHAAAAWLVVLAALAAEPALGLERRTASHVILRAGPAAPPTFVEPEPEGALRAQGAMFQVAYKGFRPAARAAALERALAIWARRIGSPVPITIEARFAPAAAGLLASAGPNFIWRDFEGAPDRSTWYADALANRLAGRQMEPGEPDIVASFNSIQDWHFGSGPVPAGKYDFTSVALHEIGHGLGFLGLASVTRGMGQVRLFGYPSAYDRFVENEAGRSLVRDFATKTKPLGAQLQGGNLFFDSALVRAANDDARPRLYAPNPFDPGSSHSHLDEAAYPPGEPDSLMTPALGRGETIHRAGPIALAILATIGW